MTIFVSAIWSVDGVANYNVREHSDAAEAGLWVEGNKRRLLAAGWEADGFYYQKASDAASSCKTYKFRKVENGIIMTRETGFWCQEAPDSERNPGHCEAAYLGVA